MREPTLLNMTEAAEMVGMKRPTFYRKVKEKGVSTTIDGGKQKVDVSELIRVFDSDLKLNNKQSGTSERSNTESKSSKTVLPPRKADPRFGLSFAHQQPWSKI